MQIDDSQIIEVIRTKAKKLGNSAYASVRRKHVGKKCVVIILEEKFFK
jgi:putative transposon-encoded protein